MSGILKEGTVVGKKKTYLRRCKRFFGSGSAFPIRIRIHTTGILKPIMDLKIRRMIIVGVRRSEPAQQGGDREEEAKEQAGEQGEGRQAPTGGQVSLPPFLHSIHRWTRRSSVADPDPNFFHPGSEFFPSRIRIKEFKYFNPKKWSMLSEK